LQSRPPEPTPKMCFAIEVDLFRTERPESPI
jgi:hypothetical protein